MSDRYVRQKRFAPVGEEGQKKIQHKHVLIVGAGALGSSSAEMLTRAGIGKLTIVDRDYIEESNLQRQQLYTEQDAKEKLPKAVAAANRLRAINSDVDINGIMTDANTSTLLTLSETVDIIIDGTDNMETRMIINDISQLKNIPWIFGACVSSFGMSFTVIPKKTSCLHCLLKTIPIQEASCETAGIISPAVQMVSAYQVAEALKILVEDWKAVRSEFVSFDLWHNQSTRIKMEKAKDENCLTCGIKRTYPFLQQKNHTKAAMLCGRSTIHIRPAAARQLNLAVLAKQLIVQGYNVKGNPYLIYLEVDGKRVILFKDGRALIHETTDVAAAKSMYHKILSES
ncbi:ThiF family adenylyltransferase [Bacillaceae bacterium Marseille-Q3522]|nr:ThiF family adenylyltransferase [Bacillaceae bacterium Marseille-Q3522]